MSLTVSSTVVCKNSAFIATCLVSGSKTLRTFHHTSFVPDTIQRRVSVLSAVNSSQLRVVFIQQMASVVPLETFSAFEAF